MRKPWYDDPIWMYNNRGLVAVVAMVLGTGLGFAISLVLMWFGF